MNSKNKSLLAIFLKNPELGKVKTRVASSMGNQKALEIYNHLLNHTLDVAEKVNCSIALYFSDKIDHDLLKKNFDANLQNGADLGERLKNTLARSIATGFHKVILIGSDCPYLSENHIEEAFQLLDEHEVVIGPAKDGGYYLIGFNALYSEVFNGISWSTDQVLNQTIQILKRNNLSYTLLEELSDVDTEKDWSDFLKTQNIDS